MDFQRFGYFDFKVENNSERMINVDTCIPLLSTNSL